MGLPTITAREQVAFKRWPDGSGVGIGNRVVVESSYFQTLDDAVIELSKMEAD